jgi:hypothetical protein
MSINAVTRWLNTVVLEPGKQLRWSYLPPLMVYFAAGVSGITAIVGAFFVKDYLGLSAAFLASLSFWVGIPWALKIPLGHLVDIIWKWKSLLVYVGATIVAISLLIVYGLIAHPLAMSGIMGVDNWYVTSVLLAPSGYVIQDVVADAMTVEAVPLVDKNDKPFSDAQIKSMHVTMQTLGRIAIVSGFIAVAAINIGMFSNVQMMSEVEKMTTYADIYLFALVIPVISVVGVTLGSVMLIRRKKHLRAKGLSEEEIIKLIPGQTKETVPNYWILCGGLSFVVITIGVGLADVPLDQEFIFLGSMAIVTFIIHKLIQELDPNVRNQLVGTAIIIFVFRAVPLPGPGATWWEIDLLGFDQQFLSTLTLISSTLALAGMLIIRPMIAEKSIAYIVVVLTIAGGILSLPNIGLYYGVHHWTSAWSSGVIDARSIAIFDTALESPLAQIAMIPMLAWIAKNAPANLKATFFAVMASFTNLALSASSLGTKYLNQYFVIEREVRDPVTGVVLVSPNYSDLGVLIISVAILAVVLPLVTVVVVQNSHLRTSE